jgi:lipopolysaccharide export system protein LptA
MKRRASSSRLLAVVALLASSPLLAVESDRDKPMDIDADSMQSNVNEGTATLTGNVRIVQGTLDVRAAKAVVTQDEQQQVSRAVLTGSPATLAQDLDDGGRLDARAAQIDYDMANDRVVLTGNAVVAQPRGELRGERITYSLNDGRIEAGGPEGGNRVFMRMNPQVKPPAEAAEPAAASTDKPQG